MASISRMKLPSAAQELSGSLVIAQNRGTVFTSDLDYSIPRLSCLPACLPASACRARQKQLSSLAVCSATSLLELMMRFNSFGLTVLMMLPVMVLFLWDDFPCHFLRWCVRRYGRTSKVSANGGLRSQWLAFRPVNPKTLQLGEFGINQYGNALATMGTFRRVLNLKYFFATISPAAFHYTFNCKFDDPEFVVESGEMLLELTRPSVSDWETLANNEVLGTDGFFRWDGDPHCSRYAAVLVQRQGFRFAGNAVLLGAWLFSVR